DGGHDADLQAGRPSQPRQDAVAEKHTDHVHLALGEVQELEDPVDHRVAECDQRVEAAQHKAVPEQLERSSPPEGTDVVDDAEQQRMQVASFSESPGNAGGPPEWAARRTREADYLTRT